jgi:PAS domain S-box-containing protein
MRHRLRKYRIPLALLGIALVALAAGRWGHENVRQGMLAELRRDATAFAAAFNPEELGQLAGTHADAGTPAYTVLKQRLMRLRAVDPKIRFAYIFRQVAETNRVIFLADSEPPDSPEISLPGDDYTEAAQSPGLQEILRTGRPTTEGPLKDEFGAWVTGYATLAGKPGGAKEVLGLDVAALDWQRRLWGGGLQSIIYVLILLGLPLAGYVIMSRQLEQNKIIRNLFEAMEQSPSAVMILDLGEHIEFANAGFCRQTGHARRELIGRPWRDIRASDMPAELSAELGPTVRAGRVWTGEWLERRRDGSRYPVRCSVTPVQHRTGEIACFVAVFEDMAAIRHNEAVLRESLGRAEAGDHAKGQFLAMMSHEVRTPLNGIVGFTNLLMETPLTAEQLEYMQTIHQSAESLIQLTSDILDFARIESGKFKLEPERCDPRACLEDALDLLATRAADKGLELLHWADEDVPLAVWADTGRLRQVLINLINNAVKFTDTGRIEVTLSARRLAASGETVPEWELQFTVRDTGPGIAADQQKLLFKPFTQGDNATTRRHGGTGLGLAISRNLVQLMGGHISLESTPGQGAAFIFTVQAPAVPDGAALSPACVAGLRLGVAAADSGLRRELVRLGEAWGATVIATTMAELPAQAWEVALVDLNLVTAGQLAVQLKPRVGFPREKVIGLVPLALPPAIRTALQVHFRQLINKPVHHQELRAMLVAQAAAAATEPARPARPARPATGHFDLQVLLVEDNPVNQRLMQRVLTKLGCEWELAANGQLAIEALARRNFDTVLMDLHMPEMDGPTAIAHIRQGGAGEKMSAVWIIALTADARADQRERVLAGGANDYLTKPLKPAELVEAFQRLLAARSQR